MYKLEKENVELLVIVVQRIWLRGNAVVFWGNLLSPTQLVKNAMEATEKFYMAK